MKKEGKEKEAKIQFQLIIATYIIEVNEQIFQVVVRCWLAPCIVSSSQFPGLEEILLLRLTR